MRTAPAWNRALWAGLLAILLALRLVGSTGYMPAFAHGRPTIVACPGADENAPLALGGSHHHHGKTGHVHAPCPYAAAGALGAFAPDFTPLVELLVFAAAILLGRTFLFVESRSRHERPPLRGPPIPA